MSAGARQWYERNKDAVASLKTAIPGFSDNAEAVVKSMERVAQIQANPGKPLTNTQFMTLASLNGFGRLVARMAGASAGEWIGKRLLPSGSGRRATTCRDRLGDGYASL